MTTIIVALITAVGTGGVFTGLAALLRVKPDATDKATQIVISGAKDVVVIQAALLETMQKRLKELEERVNELESENETLKRRIDGPS
jgi:cysteine synthase